MRPCEDASEGLEIFRDYGNLIVIKPGLVLPLFLLFNFPIGWLTVFIEFGRVHETVC